MSTKALKACADYARLNAEINREAVLQAEIRTLQMQLKEAKSGASFEFDHGGITQTVRGSNEAIKALLELDESGVLSLGISSGLARTLLAAASVRLAAATGRTAELEAENAGLALDKLTAPAAQDGLRIVRAAGPGPDPYWQDYDVHFSNRAPHYCMIRMVRRMRGSKHDEPAFPLIERRLLAGNPVEV